MVRRIFVEKRQGFFDIPAQQLCDDLTETFRLTELKAVRIINRYDIEGLSDEEYEKVKSVVFSEPPVDVVYEEKLPHFPNSRMFAMEYLPGQYDVTADSAAQCVQLVTAKERPVIRTARVIVIVGDVDRETFEKIKSYLINKVESREASLEKPESLEMKMEPPADVKVLDDFNTLDDAGLHAFMDKMGFAMSFEDLKFCQEYFRDTEHRAPTVTELRVIDTYWSDHCRHTTFTTAIDMVDIEDGYFSPSITRAYEQYLKDRENVYGASTIRDVTLMDLAVIGMKELRKEGLLEDLDKSEEINACSIQIKADIGGREEDWLVMFKNETHNHPTEIEPFGGAATCLGGAIRDPLSGRGYVYQAMRVTGAADPTVPVSETIEGKLPQKKLVLGAAQGYSSYGNQIGLATGEVREIYHPDYVAKRMEIGAVMGAAPRKNVIREDPAPGDVIILLGGRTGRDGMGGATGASKAHTEESLSTCGAEVQKGNAPTERKLQRLFRRPEVAHMIKKCNDFGAGGVSVAIGELADGIHVNMDLVPKKYEGLDGTELAISESQERMAVVIDPKDKAQFLQYAAEENLEATHVATVTEEPRLVLDWRGKAVVDISRKFLATNGAHQENDVVVDAPSEEDNYFHKIAAKGAAKFLDGLAEDSGDDSAFDDAFEAVLSDLNVCSQKGLVERFDSSIGAATVTMPYGGRYQLTGTQAMTAKIPVYRGTTHTVSMMSYGFDPYLSSWSPYHGAIYAVTESIAKIIASGGSYDKLHFTFQEYFRRMNKDPERWSQPFAALLGAYDAQIGYGIASIGGKDSSSGTFDDKDKEINVPPTLVSFAVDIAQDEDIITPELKNAGDVLVRFRIPKDEYDIPVYDDVITLYKTLTGYIRRGSIRAAYALDSYGAAAAAAKMAFGNKLGVTFNSALPVRDFFENALGDILVEISAADAAKLEQEEALDDTDYAVIGTVSQEGVFRYGNAAVPMERALQDWEKTLEPVFPTIAVRGDGKVDSPVYDAKGSIAVCTHKVGQPTVFIPVFPGTNCEYDSAAAFENAGARTIVRVFRNITPEGIRDSVDEFRRSIEQSQIIMFPGGFSAGDEPDGSAKFFATSFRNEAIRDAVTDLLEHRDGLVLGICNGFQALIKLGLVPNGKITGQDEESPTLTFNTIGRHISKEAYIRIVSNKSPWLQEAVPGKVYVNPASHGEGRFVAPKQWLEKLFANGQVATQYCDPDGNVTMDEHWNINGSFSAIEGITSPDGRVLGKMCHAERRGDHVAVNIYGDQDLKIFSSGVKYFE